MQHKLFAELSGMFGKEVPLYDKAQLVNRSINRAACNLLGQIHQGFSVTDAQLDIASGERHGAIRIGRADEYRWVSRFFAAFAMEPHNYYDMTSVGSRSQPIVATAFRSQIGPDHRVFTSLLQTDYFAPATQARIEALLATRHVFSDLAKDLIEQGERQGGLDWADANALIAEGTSRIFKWTGKARDHALYQDLCAAGFKIAADIACFQTHHLNHLTPNTLCMDLYTAAMKYCMGEIPEAAFRDRAVQALSFLATFATRDYLILHFKHLPREQINALTPRSLDASATATLADSLIAEFRAPEFQLAHLPHAGFKEFTEGPSHDTPVLLRQDAYKALTEPVEFASPDGPDGPDGTLTPTTHTARFGEVEQRFYATTPAGRDLYDQCLALADAAREKDPSLPKRDYAAYQALYAQPFAPFPKTLAELFDRGLIRVRFTATDKGQAAQGSIPTTDPRKLISLGYLEIDGLRYEDFLPVSAAGIFASNLSQYGTKSTAAIKPTYTRAALEKVLGRPIIDSDTTYAAMEAESLLAAYSKLGLLASLLPSERSALEASASSLNH